MDPLLGRNTRVKIGAAVVANIADWNLDFETSELDASVLGTGWGATLPGMQKWVATVSGFLDLTDTTGQLALKNAKFSGTKITNIAFFQDSTSSWVPDITTDSAAGAYILGMSIKTGNNELVKVEFKVGGKGPITLV